MFSDRWKPLTRADPRQLQFAPSRGLVATAGNGAQSRHSNCLQQFFDQIRGEQALKILDLSGASQANIAFITDLGHKLYSEDLVKTLEFVFGDGDMYENQCAPDRQQAFLDEALDYPENHFDGALLWDVLEFLTAPLLKVAIERLHRIMRPGSYALALFHAEERGALVPTYSYRIAGAGTLLLAPRGLRQPAQFFNNRSIERLFQSFEAVKFFLTRDALREVIVKR